MNKQDRRFYGGLLYSAGFYRSGTAVAVGVAHPRQIQQISRPGHGGAVKAHVLPPAQAAVKIGEGAVGQGGAGAEDDLPF